MPHSFSPIFGSRTNRWLTPFLAVPTLALATLPIALQAAAPIIDVYASFGPNGDGSTTTTSNYTQNALNAIVAANGGTTTPTVTTNGGGPATYSEATSGQTNQFISTPFTSWMGYAGANVTNVYGSAYSTQTGQRLYFGLDVRGDGTTRFSLSGLTFSANDLNDNIPGDNPIGTATFNNSDLSSGAFLFYNLVSGNYVQTTPANANTLVDRIVYRGVGESFFDTNLDNSLVQSNADPQTRLNAQIFELNTADNGGPPDIQGVYSIAGATGQASVPLATSLLVPEPSSVLACFAGGLGLAVVLRKKLTERRA